MLWKHKHSSSVPRSFYLCCTFSLSIPILFTFSFVIPPCSASPRSSSPSRVHPTRTGIPQRKILSLWMTRTSWVDRRSCRRRRSSPWLWPSPWPRCRWRWRNRIARSRRWPTWLVPESMLSLSDQTKTEKKQIFNTSSVSILSNKILNQINWLDNMRVQIHLIKDTQDFFSMHPSKMVAWTKRELL